MPAPIDPVILQRARALIERGIPMEEVARRLDIGRMSLYRYGYRSIRGYNK